LGNPSIFVFMVVGFVAQMIDGALGMAYGVSSTTFLLSLGVPPALASASVHSAEVATTAVSGLFHLRLGNVDRQLFLRLLVPGVIGGVVGAYILTSVPGDVIKPIINVYLLAMGLIILRKSLSPPRQQAPMRRQLVPLGLAGGFFDAIGGGGWGPIVTSTVVAAGNNPRYAVGSVNAAEFFVTVCESVTFFLTLGAMRWETVLGLLLGGVLAAPLAAYVCARLPTRALMRLVGILIMLLSLRTLYITLQ
jgi:uncharacterized membrane protein YfcA